MSARVEVRLDDPGDSDELEVLELRVEPGATVAAGDVLLEVATDKANVDVPAPRAGTVAEIPVAVGDIVAADQVLAVLEEA